MYALKLMTEREGCKVEESHYLGNMYRLEFFPVVDNPDIATRLEYSTKEGIPAFDIKRTDHAYITTVTGDTVRVICRGKVSIGSY